MFLFSFFGGGGGVRVFRWLGMLWSWGLRVLYDNKIV